MVPKDTSIRIAPLPSPRNLKWGYGITPSLVLTTKSIRPVTLMFSRSLDFKNLRPQSSLYLSHVSAGHRHTICTVPAHCLQSCRCVSPSWNMWAARVVRSANSPTALEASVYSLPEALLFYLAEVHWLGSWTGDNPYRSPTCSDAAVSNDSRWLSQFPISYVPFNFTLLSVPGLWVFDMVSSFHGHKTKPICLMTYIPPWPLQCKLSLCSSYKRESRVVTIKFVFRHTLKRISFWVLHIIAPEGMLTAV